MITMQQEPLYTVLYWDGGYAVGKWKKTISANYQKAKEIFNQITRMGYVTRIMTEQELDQNGFPNPPERTEFEKFNFHKERVWIIWKNQF